MKGCSMKRRHWIVGPLLLIVYAVLAIMTIAEGELRDYPLQYKMYDGVRFNRVQGTRDYVNENDPDSVIIIEKAFLKDSLETSFNSLEIVRDFEALEVTYRLGYKTVTCDIRMESCEGGDPETLFTKNEMKLLDEYFEEPPPPLGGLGIPSRLGILTLLYVALSVSVLILLRMKGPDEDIREADSHPKLQAYEKTYPLPLRKSYTNIHSVSILVSITSVLFIWFLFL